jgi:hypothetical protein
MDWLMKVRNSGGDSGNYEWDKDKCVLDVCFQAETDTRSGENAPCAALIGSSILALNDFVAGGCDAADVDLMAQPVLLSGPHSGNSSRAPT